MTETDLKMLKDVSGPAPRPEVRRAAIAAAVQAFERHDQHDATGTQTRSEFADNPNSAQGSGTAIRPIDAVIQKPRRAWMRRNTYALAASVAGLAIGLTTVWSLKGTQVRGLQPPTVAIAPQAARGNFGEPANPSHDAPRQVQVIPVPSVDLPKPASPTIPGLIINGSDPASRQTEEKRKAEIDRGRASPSDNNRIAALADKEFARKIDEAAAETQLTRARKGNAQPGEQQLATLPPASAAPAPGLLGYIQEGSNDGSRKRIDGDARVAHSQDHIPPQLHAEQGRDRFANADMNPIKSVAAEPVSTFSIDVDTASYSFVRRALNAGRLPQKAAVRVEEMINYFPYAYPGPDGRETPFQPTVTVLPSPWNAANKLVHIAIKGYGLKSADRPRANLVFLVDVSGSMAPADRLPLLKTGFRMLLDNLRPDDTVAIVTYASGSDIRLQPTKVAEKWKIAAAIESLNAGGSTHGAAGITDAYKVAEAHFDKTAVNRVILATDGDWNVGITDRSQLKSFIERKRETGIYLSILGVGMGNHNDALMQTLAQNGNGVAAYIDTLNEARKVLVDEASSTLFPIAKDVKIQLEFNPARVSEYRLIGYETRALKREDFNNDKVDAGDIGSGHTVTAIYEITPVGAPQVADTVRYGNETANRAAAAPAVAASPETANELGFLKLRYKLPTEDTSRLTSFPITSAHERRVIDGASTEVRFSTAVAAFGQLLRGQPYMKNYSYDDVISLANGARGDDPFGYRAEFVSLARLAKSARP